MNHSAFLTLLAVLFLFLPSRGVFAQQDEDDGASSQTSSSAQELVDENKEKKLPAVEKLDLPAKAIIIILDPLKEAQGLLPDGLRIPLKDFQALQKRIKELEAKLAEEKLPPYKCTATARLDGNTVRIKAQFILETQRDNQFVPLGCQGGQVRDARLGDEFPFIQANAQGWMVRVPQKGKHTVELDVVVPLKARRQEALAGGTQYSFSLGLPGAAITNIDLELPEPVKELVVNKVADKAKEKDGRQQWSLELGEATELNVSWIQHPAKPNPSAPMTAQWHVTVDIADHKATTKAVLQIDDLRGMATEWRLVLPDDAELEIQGEDSDNYSWIYDDKAAVTIINGPPAQQLEIVVTVTHKQPLSKIPVGPFLLLDKDPAGRQFGYFDVLAAKNILRTNHLRFHTRGDLRPQDIAGKNMAANLEGRFKSWNLTEGLKPFQLNSPKGRRQIPPPLELELKPIRPMLETSVEYTIVLDHGEGGVRIFCYTDIEVTPFKGGIDFLDVEFPSLLPPERRIFWTTAAVSPALFPGNLLDVVMALSHDQFAPLQLVKPYRSEIHTQEIHDSLEELPNENQLRIFLQPRDFQQPAVFTPFKLTLVGEYAAMPGITHARLPLPRPIAIRDKGGKLTLKAEHGLELVLSEHGSAPSPLQQHVVVPKGSPRFVDLAWRISQPQIPVTVASDVTLQTRHGAVMQQLKFDYSKLPAGKNLSSAGRQVELYVPPEILNLKIDSGGKLLGHNHFTQTAVLEMSSDTVTLQYVFPLPQPDKNADQPLPVSLPLITPVESPTIRHTVRLWTEQGIIPSIPWDVPENKLWRDRGITGRIPGKNSLPAWTVQTEHPHASLTIMLPRAAATGVVLIDRALVQVEVQEDGTRTYKVRYLINRAGDPYLDFDFPAPVRQLNPFIYLGDRQMNWEEVDIGGNTARLRVTPEMAAGPFLLDIRFKHSLQETNLWNIGHALLGPPRIQGETQIFNGVRWQIIAPSAGVPLVTGNYSLFPQQWTWQGWMLSPRSQISGAELEKWISAPPSAVPIEGGLLARTSRMHALQMVAVPRPLWILVCSGLVLVFGLGLILPSRLRVLLWFLAALLVPALILVSMLWPAVFQAILYGAQPGVVILAAIFLVQWVLHRSHQRKVVFLPAFTRVKAESSLAQADKPRPRAPSTVDAVPSPGSSFSSSTKGSSRDQINAS